jgi:serine/threonine protein phosphatase PrpC
MGDGKKRFLFGVFDGHGIFGHDVSGLIAQRLPSHLVAELLTDPKDAFKEALKKIDDDVYANLGGDIEYSGSTCVCCMVDWTARMLHTSNVGDSRAILGRRLSDDSWEAIPLSVDQRPDLAIEKERIEMSGGTVSPHMVGGVPNGPARVWDSPALEKPGLACARSVGDAAARQLGVVAEPEVISRQIEPEDKFILIASDGVWDSLSNQEVVDMCKMYLHLPFVGAKAMTEAVRRVEGGVLTDDTTMVIVILQE